MGHKAETEAGEKFRLKDTSRNVKSVSTVFVHLLH